VRVEAREVVDSVNEAWKAEVGWMGTNEEEYAGFWASFVYFMMGRPGMQETTTGESASMRRAASVALDGPSALADLGAEAEEGVRC
jgi:hypothetical protein